MNNLKGSFANTRKDYHLDFKAAKVRMLEYAMLFQQDVDVKISTKEKPSYSLFV